MIDWSNLFFNALWLAGVALLLAFFGFYDHVRVMRRDCIPLKYLWRSRAAGGGLRMGGCLFCVGMALTGASWVEQTPWALLALYLLSDFIFLLWRARGQHPAGPTESEEVSVPVEVTRPRPRSQPHSHIGAVVEWIVRLELLWLAILSPFYLFPSATFALALLGVPLLWVARRVARGRFLPSTPFDWPLALIALMSLVSLYATFDIGFSLSKVAGLLFGIGVFYAVVDWVSNRPRMGWALAGYVLLGGALAAVGLLGAGWVNKVPVLKEFGNVFPMLVQGLPGAENGIHPNELAGALMWVVPLQVALLGWSWSGGLRAGRGRWAQRLGLLLVASTSAGTLLLTQSRGALGGFAVAMLLLLFLALWRARILLLLLLLLGGVAIAYMGPQQITDKLVETFGTGFSPTDSVRSIGGREEIWSRAIYGIEDFSITGMGMGTFRRVMPTLYPSRSFAPSQDLGHAHNHLLQTALDLGLPGLVAYLALWMLAALLALLAWRRSSDGLSRAAVAGTIGGLLAYFVYGITDTVALGAKPGVFFWVLLALLAVLWRMIISTAPTATPTPLPVRLEINEKPGVEEPEASEEAERTGIEVEAEHPVLAKV